MTPQTSTGLQFRKLDLHLHTPASKDFDDPSVTPEQIVAAALEHGLAGIAVTDHNSGEWVDRVKDAAKGSDLVVFPGVEITCSGGRQGIHIIALFDPSCDKRHVEGLLANLGLQPENYGDLTSFVSKTPIEVAEIIAERNGLAVLAHANSTSGALNEMRGEHRTQLVRSGHVHAVEATDFQKSTGKKLIEILDGSDPTYRIRKAVYQASDNPGTRDGTHGLPGIGTRTAQFKLDKINIEGLRQCFADPEVRIRQDFEDVTFRYPRITNVTITGGFLDGASASFHEGLNSILGAKGAGKSLLIEFLRFALNQSSTHPGILKDHTSKLENRLQLYGKVSVTIEDETGRSFLLQREFRPADDNPYDERTKFDPAQVFPVLFLSQNEIIYIAENEKAQLEFIDKFFDFRPYQKAIQELEESLGNLDTDLASSLRSHHKSKEIKEQLETANTELAQLDEALKSPIFEEFRRAEQKRLTYEQFKGFVQELIDLVSGYARSGIETSPDPPDQLKDDPALKRVKDLCDRGSGIVSRGFEEMLEELKKIQSSINSEYAAWEPAFIAISKKYDAEVRERGGTVKALAQKRAKKAADVAALQKHLNEEESRARKLRDIAEARKQTLDKLQAEYLKYTNERKAKAQKFEEQSQNRLRIQIHQASDKDEFRRRLMTLKKGSYLRDADVEAICGNIAPTLFVGGIINYSITGQPQRLDGIVRAVQLPLERVRALANYLLENFAYEDLLALQHKAIPQDQPEIRFDIGGGTFEELKRLSVGQKATAMLIIALSDGSMPIVIDQPEDSLDIRTVWEDMCMKIRRGKERRQFIFTTHNSSLAVASDTDNFVILEGDATHGKIVYSGSMDHSPISEEVLKYLEGGVPTYKAKFAKYDAQRRLKED